jgi:ABC-2 type transport system permease protein
MRKILLVAQRDFKASIRSKPFLFGLILTPILAGGGFIGIGLMKAKPDIRTRRVAIVDHTGRAAAAVIEAAAEKNAKDMFDKETGRQVVPRYTFETVAPDDAHRDAGRLALADRVRRGELFAFLEIGRDAVHPPQAADPEKAPEASRVNYYSNAGGMDETRAWLSGPITDGLRRVRLAEAGVDPGRFADILGSVTVRNMGLPSRDARTGGIRAARKKNDLAEFAVPYALLILMVLIVIASSSPMLGGVAEDKMQRVFEMLLACATPFELIAGKVAAAVALSVTSSALYVAGGLVVLQALAMMGLAPISLLGWFVIYLVADVMILAALATAIGAACASPNDAQHLAMLVLSPVVIPMFIVAPVMQQPNGTMATVLSLIPPFTPLLMLMRQAMPGGVPAWQPWVGLIGVAAWTVAASWAAARIFRIGILMQGKTASITELLRWAVRG